MSETELSTGLERSEALGENQFSEASRPGVCCCSVCSHVTRFLPPSAPGQFSVYPSSLPSLFSGCLATMVPSQCPPPGQAVLWGAWLPCPCQDALWGVSHHEGEVTPSLRNAGLMRTAASQGLENRDQELLCHLERYQLPFPGDKDKALRFCGSSCENHLAQRVSSMVSSTQNILECPP